MIGVGVVPFSLAFDLRHNPNYIFYLLLLNDSLCSLASCTSGIICSSDIRSLMQQI